MIGGYSAVNFYNDLGYLIPPGQRPKVSSIRYELPGWIGLALLISVAHAIKTFTYAITNGVKRIDDTYTNIHRNLTERKLLRFKREQIARVRRHETFIESSLHDFAAITQFENLEELKNLTGDSLRSLKILFSVYRRARILREYIQKDKLSL